MVIRTPDYHLRVFVSSTLKELADERKVVRQAIIKLCLAPVMFEAGARPHPPRELYQAYLAQSKIFIGVYWQSYGWVAPEMHISGLEDEYNLSGNMPRLIYIKNPAPERDPALSELLLRIQNDKSSSYTYFSSLSQLRELVKNDLALMLSERFEAFSQPEKSTVIKAVHPPTNVPTPRNPLIGRQRELKAADDMLLREDVALVTLTGPAGTGKSRLAIQVGQDMLDHFQDGVSMVRLEPIHEPQLVIPTIAETLGIHETPDGRPAGEILKDFLRDKQTLLILDNFEQVVEAAPRVAELLEACPRLKCLITSRTPLHLRLEKELHISPLNIPPIQQPVDAEQLSQYSAVELFIQRAQAVNPDFSITSSNAPAVAEICYQLDGLPLGIELAAAKIKVFPPANLLTRLQHRFDLLTGGTRDLPERQRTLRGAIDWSFNLLSETEKKLFRRLAVFVGGFSLEAAETICDLRGDLAPQLDDSLAALIDSNLVIQLQEFEDAPRFGMLGTIHDYACELLMQSDDFLLVHQQHARFFLDFVNDIEPRIRSADRVRAQQVMQQDLGNVRGVLEWVSKTGECIEIGQRIVITLGLYWHICGYVVEGEQWCTKMLALCDSSTPVILRAGLLCHQASLNRAERDQQSVTDTIDQSLELCRMQGNSSLLGIALVVRGMVAYATRDLAIATTSFQEAAQIFKSTKELWFEVVALSWLGDVVYLQNDITRAEELHNESIRLGRIQGDPWCLMPSLMSSAQTDMIRGDMDTAYTKLVEIIDVLHQTGDRWSLSWTLIDMGQVTFQKGKLDQARENFREGITLANTFGNLRAIVIGLAGAAAVIAGTTQSNGEQNLRAQALAAQICGATLPHLEIPGIFMWLNTKKIYDDSIAYTKRLVAPDLWAQAYAEGQSIPIEKALDLAVQALNPSS